MEELTIRKAVAADLERIAELVAGDPGQEAVALAGCAEAARAFGMALVRLTGSPQGWERSTLAKLDGRVVGVAQTSHGTESFPVTPRLALLALRTFGVGIVSVLGRARARHRVDIPHAKESYHVEELNVDPSYRSRGIGGALLDEVEAQARNAGLRMMSLNTTTVNPARRLYERHGFRVAETRTDAVYERYTGIAGRHLMVKELL